MEVALEMVVPTSTLEYPTAILEPLGIINTEPQIQAEVIKLGIGRTTHRGPLADLQEVMATPPVTIIVAPRRLTLQLQETRQAPPMNPHSILSWP